MSTERNKEQAGALKQYEYTDAVETAKAYFKGDDLAATVWVSKYALKDSMGKIYENSPEQMHRRIAREIERIEKRYPNPMSESEVYDLLKDFRYLIPQGGPMTGIGNNLQIASLSNCFVIGHRKPADSYGGIIRIDEEQVQLMKRRGGVGHDLSHIRPTGSPVLNSALTSTGIVPFMERYSNSTREVAQDGRRGALMLSLSIKHPDAENFIDAKVETGKVTGANVSIKIDDEFMRAVTERVQRRHIGLHQHLDDRHERGDHDDERRDADLVGNDVLDQRNHKVRHDQHGHRRQPHAHAVFGRSRRTQRGAHAQHQHERRVVLDDAARYNLQFIHFDLLPEPQARWFVRRQPSLRTPCRSGLRPSPRSCKPSTRG